MILADDWELEEEFKLNRDKICFDDNLSAKQSVYLPK